MITWDNILTEQNKTLALNRTMAKPYLHGPDGMLCADVGSFLSINEKMVEQTLRNGTYTPGYVSLRETADAHGKVRHICQINSLDRYILRCIAQVLAEDAEPVFSNNSYAYRTGRGVNLAVSAICDYLNSGDKFVVSLDLEKFYERIDLQLLLEFIRPFLAEASLFEIIKKYLLCPVRTGLNEEVPSIGLLQGSPLSPVLSNIYLLAFDTLLDEKQWHFIRYGDDLKAFFQYPLDAKDAFLFLRNTLQDDFHIALNEKKSTVCPATECTYFGYTVSQKDGTFQAKKKKKTDKSVHAHWHSSPLLAADGYYHIMEGGILSAKDYAILFEGENSRVKLPPIGVDSISFYSEVSLTPQMTAYAKRNEVRLNFFDSFGQYLGSYIPKEQAMKGEVMLKQAAIYLDNAKRLQLAQKIEAASLHTVTYNLKYYYQRSKKQFIGDAINRITRLREKLQNCKDIDKLLLYEAQSRETYYQCFNPILNNKQFRFTTRTRNPPEDYLNCMISFGNTLIYRRVADEIYKSNLDIRIGFAHYSARRSESLNLDLAELFKPVIVDHVIFHLVNKKMLDTKKDFESSKDGKGIWLSNSGKKLFLDSFRKRLYQTTTIKGKKITYNEVMHKEIRYLQSCIEKGNDYHPFFLQ